MIDLFAGLGGASSAFVDDDEWTVLQLDNNPDLKEYNPRLVMCDITDTEAVKSIIAPFLHGMVEAGKKVVLWASPPCLEFSLAFSAPGPTAQRAGIDFQPSMECLEAALAVRDWLMEVHPGVVWVVENVRGAVRHFATLIGEPKQNVAKFFLWGNFPMLAFRDRSVESHTMSDDRWSPIRANIRAVVPIEISQALKESVTVQRTLF
jgi:site-specific DNA-cytosine methylase